MHALTYGRVHDCVIKHKIILFTCIFGLLTAPVECAANEFQCLDSLNNTMCIHTSWRCDGSADCDDQSDEHGCHETRCGAHHFACATSDECIHEAWLCDGDFDCFDGSDERNCKSRCDEDNLG